MPRLSSHLNFEFTIPAKFVIVLKIANYQHAPFCHLIWIFGQTLGEFLVHSPYLSKFAVCQYFRLCHLIWGFASSWMDSCSALLNSPFSQICHFCEIANCQYACFVVSSSQSLSNSTVSQNMSFSYSPQVSTCLFRQTLNKFFPNFPIS